MVTAPPILRPTATARAMEGDFLQLVTGRWEAIPLALDPLEMAPSRTGDDDSSPE